MDQTPQNYYAIGLMSGSSLDGLDISYCKYSFQRDVEEKASWSFELIYAKTVLLGVWESKLKAAVSLSDDDLENLGEQFASFLASEVNEFIKEFQINDLDVVVSHGHTISHHPEEGRTCQIGDGQTLANQTAQLVINNLRQEDMNHGGQGAPIVPIGDKLLFRKHQFCLNLGGIANISIKTRSEIIAFDICTANQVLNHYAQVLGAPYDDGGAWARTGTVNTILLERLNEMDYCQKVFPKSLDNSYSKKIILLINSLETKPENALATYVEHIAHQVSSDIRLIAKQFLLPLSDNVSMLVTGGGAFNEYLIERIQAHILINLEVPEAEIINYKEALVMGFIGVLKLRNEVNVLASVTGASRDTICGDIYSPIK